MAAAAVFVTMQCNQSWSTTVLHMDHHGAACCATACNLPGKCASNWVPSFADADHNAAIYPNVGLCMYRLAELLATTLCDTMHCNGFTLEYLGL